jgi:O-antigen ligase/polysaccharide polymerase Wzy-like membrane protein
VLVVGLALHNVVMAELWGQGVRGTALDFVSAWKEVLLLVAFLVLAWKVRTLPALTVADVFAAAYVVALIVYAVLPQSWLGGSATTHGVLLAFRHDLLPVGGYVFGRLLGIVWQESGRVGLVIALTATGVAVLGLLDVFFVPLQSWRDSGVPGWYREQLSLDYRCLSYLPENWIYNTGEESNPIRRLVSTLLSPLATAYVLTVALVFVVSRFYRWWAVVLGVVLFVSLLYTHTRAAVLALAAGLLLLALVQRRFLPALVAVVVVLVSIGFFAAYSSIGPSTSYTASELVCLRKNAQQHPGATAEPFSTSDASLSSHWRNLRDGIRTVLHHPQGYGLGNAGVVAKRTGVAIKAGESTYPELGVETGIAGPLAFVLWNLALLWALWKRRSWLAGAFAAVLLLGLQTDIIGVHWIAVVVWAAAGIAVTGAVAPRSPQPEAPG